MDVDKSVWNAMLENKGEKWQVGFLIGNVYVLNTTN